ncbi:hypothetical protein OH76DRAFT_1351594 [Lentinus brumalis]|uniref:BTB domain-containing protein n=1 Tax=Lentinus brumalis TaxID=2498619 RepID=A0A371D8U4_9APHY|nr:hypothetical protein OH76DRAFT_1351594 [Polyporus brumalis]
MSARITRKRARLDGIDIPDLPKIGRVDEWAESDSEGEERARDEEFWFDDGTIVLIAGQVEFKVYARPLVEHSPVFKDMLSLPQPESTTASKVPIRPRVHLSDSPDDLRYLFEVLMPAKVLRPLGFQQGEVSYDRLAAWIRTGHKYQIDHLVHESLRHLRQIYPDDIDVYLKSGRSAMAKRMSHIGVVNLARLTGAHDLLPIALMDCCQMESTLVRGYRRRDGTFERLSDGDLQLCFKAKGKLIEARAQLVYQLLSPGPSKDCPFTKCKDEVDRCRDSLASGVVSGLCTPTPLSSWTTIIKSKSPDLCMVCRNELIDRSNALRRGVFARLPSIIGVTVDGWGKKKPGAPAS